MTRSISRNLNAQGGKTTHDDELMIKNHRSDNPSPHIASGCSAGEKIALSSNIPAMSAFRLWTVFGQLTKQKEELLTTNRATMAPYECNDRNQLSQEIRIKATLFPYRPPIPLLIVVIEMSSNWALDFAFTKMQLNNPTKFFVWITIYPTSFGVVDFRASVK